MVEKFHIYSRHADVGQDSVLLPASVGERIEGTETCLRAVWML